MTYLTTPLVTVGVTTYNNPECLKKALNSLVNQSYKNLEIIISDDCSPGEETRSIISQFEERDNRIKSIRQEINLGPPANILFVLTQATGEYFMWADEDDLRDSRWIEVLLPKLFNKDVIASIGNVVAVDEIGVTTQNCPLIQYSGPRILRLVNYFLAEEASGKACITCGLFRTNFLRKIKHWSQYELNKYGYGDNYFNFDCLQYGNVVADQSVTIYKRKASSIKNSRNHLSKLNVLQNFYIRLKYFANYFRVASHISDKIIIIMLFPVKCIKSFIFYTFKQIHYKYRM